jgi:hypothetical protein
MGFSSRYLTGQPGNRVHYPLPLPERCRAHRKGSGARERRGCSPRCSTDLTPTIWIFKALGNLPRWAGKGGRTRRAGVLAHSGPIAVSFHPAVPRRVAP